MIISQLSISPIGEGTSLSDFVKKAIDVFKKHQVRFQITDMATIIETEDLDTLFKIVKEAHDAVVNAGAMRVITELKIDDRKDKNVVLGDKITAVK